MQNLLPNCSSKAEVEKKRRRENNNGHKAETAEIAPTLQPAFLDGPDQYEPDRLNEE